MMSQVDTEGHHYQVMTKVTDRNKDESAIAKVDGFIKSSSGNLHRKRATCGWKILVEWKDGSFDLVPLKGLKDLFQPKMPPTLSLPGMYRKSFIHRRNRTNS